MQRKKSVRAPSRERAQPQPEAAAFQIRLEPVGALVPYAKNARTHSPAQVGLIADSLLEFGWTNPVLLDGARGILAGHGRVLGAARLWEQKKVIRNCPTGQIPCLDLGWLSPEQQRAYVLADNQLGLRAGWDTDLLGAELNELKIGGFDLGLIGFDAPDLNRLLSPPKSGRTDENDVPPVPENPVSRPGDVWRCGAHRIGCGDSCDPDAVGRLLAGARPGLMVTDPPYGVDYDPQWRTEGRLNQPWQKVADGVVQNDHRADWREAWALFPGDVAYVWHGGLHAGVVQESLGVCGFQVRAQIIWAKQSLVIGRGHYHWQHEACWYAVRKGATGHWAGDRKQATLWQIANMHATQGNVDDGKTVHSTQKPVECMRRAILNNSLPGEYVYEPFSGSGTTVIACEDTGRHCYAMELSAAYVDLAVRRWEAFTGKEATLDAPDHPKFAAVAAERAPEVVA